MRLLALVEKPGHVCYRYRIEAYAGALAGRGWTVEAASLAGNHWELASQLRKVAAADAVVWQRKLVPHWWLWMIRRAARLLVYDVDDAMFYRDSNAAKGAASLRRLRRFRGVVRLADAVTAGNSFLVQRAAACGARRVLRVPTTVDAERYQPARHFRSGPETRLAWIGSKSTMASLHLAADGLALASRRLGSLELRLICDCSVALGGVNVTPRRWSAATEAAELADADVGISWLPDHPWSLGKCGLKVLQYMAAGLPVVANPVGVHREMVVPGQTGFLAQTPHEWAEAIGRLAADPSLRAAMGARARQRVRQEYDSGRWGQAFADLLDAAAPLVHLR